MANIFKIDQFKGLDKPVGSARVIGSGASMSIPIHTTGYSIRVSPLLSAIVGQLSSALRDARVEVIDTSPISRADVVGLAKYEIRPDTNGYIDREAGKIYVDVKKIVDHVMNGMFPSNVQMPNEGASMDPDLKKSVAKKVYDAIAREIADTVAHEAHHKKRTLMDIREGKPVDYNPESEAEAAGHQVKKTVNVSPQF